MSVIGINDDYVLLRAGMHSSAATDDGISYAIDQASPGTPTYSAQGADFDASAKALQFQLAVQHPNTYRQLATGGKLSFEVPLDIAASTTTIPASKYFISKTQGWIEKNSGGWLRTRFPSSTGFTIPTFFAGTEQKPSRVVIDIAWNEREEFMFIDGLCLKTSGSDMMINLSPTSQWTNLYVGGLTTGAGTYPTGYPISNVVLSYEPFYYSQHLEYGRVLFLGDSLIRQGSTPSGHRTPAQVWDPGGGFLANGDPSTSGQFNSDNTLTQQFARDMLKGGVALGNCANEAQSGVDIAACKTRSDNWFAVSGNVADVVVCLIGTNEVPGTDDEAGWRTSLRGMVDSWVANGVKKAVFGTVISLRNDPTYQTQAYNDRTDLVNSVINEMPSYNSICSVVDRFTLFGGFDVDSADFQTDDFHTSAQGSTKDGALLANGVLKAIA